MLTKHWSSTTAKRSQTQSLPPPSGTACWNVANDNAAVARVRNTGLLLAVLVPLAAAPLFLAAPTAVDVAGTRIPGAATHSELRSIDRELQGAYVDGASDQELAALWARRELYQAASDGISPLSL
jgi:hypothetical protein